MSVFFFFRLRKLVVVGRDEYFSGLSFFFLSKFLMAPKVGVSACMLDGGYST